MRSNECRGRTEADKVGWPFILDSLRVPKLPTVHTLPDSTLSTSATQWTPYSESHICLHNSEANLTL